MKTYTMKVITILSLSAILLLIGCQTKKKTDSTNVESSAEKWSVKMADAVMHDNDSLVHYLNPKKVKWEYDFAFLGQAIDRFG